MIFFPKKMQDHKNASTHFFTLNFLGENKKFETEFKKHHFKNNFSHFRYCFIYSILLYTALAAIDYTVFHEKLNLLLTIRFFFVIPILSLGLLYTSHKSYALLWRLTNNFFVVMASTGFIAMMILCGPPMSYSFYAGVSICLIFGYTFIRSYFLDASVTGIIVLTLYAAAAAYIETPYMIFINNFIWLFTANLLGMIVCYTNESSSRREFILGKLLQIEKENVTVMNLKLELKVKERTHKMQEGSKLLKKEIEERKKSEYNFKSIFQTAPNLIASVDDQGVIVDCNHRVEQYLGYTSKEIIGSSMDKMIHPDYMDKAWKSLGEVLDKGSSYSKEYKMVHKNGTYIDVSIDSAGLKNKEGKYIRTICVITDITEQKRARDEYRRLFTAIEQSAESVLITDADANIVYVNPAFKKLTGYSKEEIIGKNPRVLKSGEHDQSFYKAMWQTLSSKKVWEGRFVNKNKSGYNFYEEVSITPVMDDNDAIINFVAVKKDVTKQIAMEKRFRQSNKMEAVGTLAGGIAHDFNNILYPIIGFTEMSIDELSKDHPIQENLEDILQEAKRAAGLVNQILMFSMQQATVKKPICIQTVCAQALQLLRATIPANIEFNEKICESEDYILGDPTELHEIIINLCTNAYHAMEDTGGTITIELHKKAFQAKMNLPQKEYLCLSVTDTGTGIPQEVQEKIFDPYFSTKEQGKGSGLGLSVVHGIVKNLQGEIKVESFPGKGTSFKVFFPIMTRTGLLD